MNDSDLIIASQQVENEQVFAKNTSKDVFKRDINGNNKDQTPPVPFASTPVPDLVKSNKPLAKETPKTTRGMSRSRNRSNGQTSLFETSIFDNDGEGENSKSVAELEAETAPRKLLKFDGGSPIKKVNTIYQNTIDFQEIEDDKRVKSGEFDDDSEDELFSQMDIPGEMEIRKPLVFESSSESSNILLS